MVRIKRMLYSALVVLLVSSCGNTGPLYLPNDKAPKKEKTASLEPIIKMASKPVKQVSSLSN